LKVGSYPIKKLLVYYCLQPDSGLLFRLFSSEVNDRYIFVTDSQKSGKVQVEHLSMDVRQKKYIGVCSNKVLDSGVVGNM